MALVSIFQKKEKKTMKPDASGGDSVFVRQVCDTFLGFGRSLNVALPLLLTNIERDFTQYLQTNLELQTFREIAIAVKRPKAQTLLFLLTFCDLF